jgi:hypothetical protein
MKYFLDTEFLEGTQDKNFLGFSYGKTKPTIDLISIGIVAEDGREYYAISKEFNLKEAWNRYDLKGIEYTIGFGHNKEIEKEKVYWIRENVLRSIWRELRAEEVVEYNVAKRRNVILDYPMYCFTYKSFKRLINKYGKTNKQIAEEVKEFCTIGSVISNKGLNVRYYKEYTEAIDTWLKVETIENNNPIHYNNKPEFYAYYADYD